MSHTVIYMPGNLLLIVKQFKADVSKMVDKMPKHDLDKKYASLQSKNVECWNIKSLKVFFSPPNTVLKIN